MPSLKNEPPFLVQLAIAEIARGRSQAALAVIDGALPRLAASDSRFDAYVLRGRLLAAMPARAAEAVGAWEQSLAAAPHPVHADLARVVLTDALSRAQRPAEALRQLDQGLAQTSNPALRSSWLDARPNLLAATGDIDAAMIAFDERVAASTDPDRRAELRLSQARATVGSRGKEAAARYDVALREIPPGATDLAQRQRAVRLEVRSLVTHDLVSVLADLDTLDASWPAPGWPESIDLRMAGLLAAGREDEAVAWLTQHLARTPALAGHPAAHQALGDAEMKRRHTDEAMGHYARAVEAAPVAADLRGWGAVLMGAFATQQWKVALNAYKQLAALDTSAANAPPIRVIVAAAHLRLGEPEAALELTEDVEPAVAHLRALRDVTRGEAQVRLRRFDQTLATTAAALERGRQGVPAEFFVTLHALRAQAFNEQGEFASGRQAASAAIDTSDEGDAALEGLTTFVRLGARMQRSLSCCKLGDIAAAHRDIDATITGFERLRDSAILRALARAPEFASFESGIWFAKGSLLDSESRSDEALAAHTRAARVEQNSNTAAVARGYALARTGAFEAALSAFDAAHPRGASDKERSEALAGKGLALVRLQRFEDAVTALHAALDARLTDPDDDPTVFELLGIAYDALQRNGAARRAFRGAWTLTAEDKRSANLARGITAAELRLNDPKAALEFLDSLPPALGGDRTLLFNQALALDALGRRRAAIGALVQARDAGLQRAQQELDRLDAPAGLGRWTHYWFGAQARPGRRLAGSVLVAVAAAALTAPLLQWWFAKTLDWYLLLLPSAVALVLLALPNMKSITVEAGKLKLSAEPLPANARDTTAGPTPESFHVPVLGAVVMASRSTLSSDAG